ncbi:MAG: CBS domain-containing protein [Planctomycetes bacterium]|nr:CBS domain-containing protein [Planctomycetota bacterium]
MITAKQLMNTGVITISPDEDIYEAMRMMALNNITGLPVIDDDGTLLGIITEKDILVRLCNSLEDTGLDHTIGTVGQFMTRHVVCFGPQDSLADIAECLSTNDFRRVPILYDGKLVGIISRKDVIRYIRDLQQQDEVLRDSILELLY